VSPRNQTVPEGTTANISCRATGFPKPHVSWSFEGETLPLAAVVKNIEGGLLLQLPKTKKPMEGTYKCTAKNILDTAASISILGVIG